MNIEHELRSASDSMLATLERLELLENEKRELKPDSPRFQRLASEIERLAADVYAKTHTQQRLGQRSRKLADQAGVEVPPIDKIEAPRDLQTILAEWRGAERRLAAAESDSADRAQATADINRLRAEYHAKYSTQSERSRDD